MVKPTVQSALTGKRLMVFEACQKIIEGERLIKEGMAEMNNLIPTSATSREVVANKILRASKVSKKEVSGSGDHRSKILAFLANGAAYNYSEIRDSLKIGWGTVKHVVSNLVSEGLVKEAKKPAKSHPAGLYWRLA